MKVDPMSGEIFEFPRKPVKRRRFMHYFKLALPALVMLFIFILLAVLLHQPPHTCEPYQGC